MDSEIIKHKKMKKIFKIPLIIIGCLIIFILSLGCFIYFFDGNTYNIYNDIIDETFIKIQVGVNNMPDKMKSSGNLKLEMSGENLTSYEESLIDIINEISFEYLIEEDSVSKKGNVNVETKYNNEELLNLFVNFIDKDVFLKIPSLYDKAIKGNEDIYYVSIGKDELSNALEEIKKIIQKNLKSEYFDKEKITLKINNKSILTTKHILDISNTELYEFEKSVVDDIKYNDILLDILSKTNNIDKNEVINKLNSLRNELEVTEDFIKIELYVNLFSKKLERISLVDSEESLIFTRKSDMYEIRNTINDLTTYIGNIKITEDGTRIIIDYDEVLLDMEMENSNLNIKLKDNDCTLNSNMSFKDEKISYLYEISVMVDGVAMKITLDGVAEEIPKISDKIISNYIKIDEVTEEDYLKIYENLYKNETLLKLITDISVIFEEYYSNQGMLNDFFGSTF